MPAAFVFPIEMTMKQAIFSSLIVLSFLLLLPAGSARAEIGFAGFEGSVTSGYTDNLLKDSSDIADSYRTANLTTNFYPVPLAEVSLNGSYTFYDGIPGLSNTVGGVGLTLIPLPASSRFSLYVAGHASKRDYREGTLTVRNDQYNTTDVDGLVSVGYRLRPTFRLRAGVSYKATLYKKTDYIDSSVTPAVTTSIQSVSDKSERDFFTGFNWTLPGSNVLDVEAGYSNGNLQRIDPGQEGLIEVDRGDTVAYNYLVDAGGLKAWYISPRISRPLGKRSGISVTYLHRSFVDMDDSTLVYGYSTGLQSPWVSTYEGDAIQISAKTYMLEKMIVSAGFSYQEKSYLDVLEMTQFHLPPNRVVDWLNKSFGWHERRDQQRQAFLYIQIPFATHSGLVMEPAARINYTSNSSSVNVYEYDDMTLSTSLNMRF